MHDDMPNEEYHARSELSAHNLMDVEVSPAYADYKKKNPGSNLQTAVTGPVSELSEKEKARRKSFCARSRGWTGERGKAARKRWRC